MQKGNISVHTENLFPIIKKFLYSDHEIFLRELISNAVDATQKLSVLAARGEVKGDLGDLKIKITADEIIITVDFLKLELSFTLEIKRPINIAGSAKSSPNFL